jgi:predicted RNA-binding Zn ribbon-like protein
MSKLKTESPFLFVGNALWLDFVNTRIVRDGRPVDLLANSADLRKWAIMAHLASEGSNGGDIKKWEELVQSAKDLRANLRVLADKMDRGLGIGSGELNVVNYHLDGLTPVLTNQDGDWRVIYDSGREPAGGILSQIALSLATLIVEDGSKFVHKCESPNCVLYFYDTSKNHKRRWCSMASCGNRHKAAVHYRRRRAD